jgi:CelD/BcsL family acetyltransferase involved in cellulose biosynthesis
VGLGLLVARPSRRWRVLDARGLHLHETGDKALDQITVEYNGLLLDRRDPAGIAAACLDRLAGETTLWNELYLPGVDPVWRGWAARIGTPDLIQDSPCPYADLTGGEEAWWRSLSGNARQQIRRAQRLYGETALEAASGTDAAWSVWADLKDLHQAAWQARGEPGAFANPAFADFHERLIAERLAAGEIRLLRLGGPTGTIACLYNFVYRGRVLSYQSGIAPEADNRRKPGLVAHAAAIAHSRAQGATVYDFLAGEAQYKRSLAGAENRLVWLAVRRPTAGFAAERALRKVKRLARVLRGGSRSARVDAGKD